MKKIYFIASPHIKDDVWIYSFFDKKMAEKVNDRINHETDDNNIVYELPLLDDPSIDGIIEKTKKFVDSECKNFISENEFGFDKGQLEDLLIKFLDSVFNVE